VTTEGALQVVVVGDQADLDAVRAALGGDAIVSAGEGPTPGVPGQCVVVSSARARSGVGAQGWARTEEVALVLLADEADDALISQWLDGGGHDWVLREHLGVLRAVLTRRSRDRREYATREEQERRLRASTAELVQLARSPRFRGDDLDSALREVTGAAVRGLAVARCGVWLFDDTHAVLRQVAQYDTRTETHSGGRTVAVSAHRAYFSTLLAQRLIAAPLCQVDPRTSEFNEDYHLPLGIVSTLDVAVRLRGELMGALCIEHVGEPRRWSAGEEAFASALADVVSLGLEGAERFRVESALLQSERRFRDLFQHTSDSTVLYRVALDGNVYCEDFNPAAEVVSGLKRDDVIGRQTHEVLEPASARKLRERCAVAIRTREPVLYEDCLELPKGTRWFNTALVPLLDEMGRVNRLAAIARDVTQQRQAESLQRQLEHQLAESQKNEALARLASHIAHDVNNLLTVVVAHAQRLQSLPGRPAEVAQAILQATSRGRELTQQVLTFGRRRPPERKQLELGPVVRETVTLLEVTAPSVVMRVELPARQVLVQADASQLHQVVTNLCTNALNAMAGAAKAALTVRLDLVDVDYAFAQQHPPLQAGKWARISVQDTGEGMDEATRRRIFEPFFSTRPSGRGTGLGLAVVQSIVQGHDGAVVVDSAPGQGSTFSVYLPAVEQDLTRPGAGQHLMLVDDHPGMARVSARLLETLGYRTSVFDDPREALSAFRNAPSTFDAIMTDLSMPQMSGEEFTRSVRAIAPRVPVIVSSGLAAELDTSELRSLGVSAVLMKPWRLEEAIATLQRVLPAA
jgi:PAS domain S-box-containing protein